MYNETLTLISSLAPRYVICTLYARLPSPFTMSRDFLADITAESHSYICMYFRVKAKVQNLMKTPCGSNSHNGRKKERGLIPKIAGSTPFA